LIRILSSKEQGQPEAGPVFVDEKHLLNAAQPLESTHA
jgi:hypothetical protein